MPETNWNEKSEYLMRTRHLYLNDDYLEFLVRQVWKLDAPAAVVDFGCGYGYMGIKLLPLLPVGSSYTGVDIALSLLAKAREVFAGSPYPARFVEADVMDPELEDGAYDLAVCHALLLHVTDPVGVLKQMRRCVRPGGLVVCIEPHHVGAMANYYHGGRQSDYVNLGALQQLYEESAGRTGKDGNIGVRLPEYMERAGLARIDCRISDKVNVLLPSQDETGKNRLLQSLRADGCGIAPRDDRETFMQRLISRGLSADQAGAQYVAECACAARYAEADLRVVWACNMMIAYGRVPE